MNIKTEDENVSKSTAKEKEIKKDSAKEMPLETDSKLRTPTVAEVSSGKIRGTFGGGSGLPLRAAATSEGDAAGSLAEAMELLKEVDKIEFPQFVASLLNGTFNAIVEATLKQTQDYADFVSDLAKTIATFQVEQVGDAEVHNWLCQNYPDGSGDTIVREDFTFGGVDDTEKNTRLIEITSALKSRLCMGGTVTKGVEKKDILDWPEGFPGNTDTTFTADAITAVKDAVKWYLTGTSLQALERMVQLGMARVVVTNGELFAKLTYHVTATETQNKWKSEYLTNSYNHRIGGKVSGVWKVTFKGAHKNSWSKLHIKTMNESTFDNATMDATIIGQVKINFKTESFPTVMPPAETVITPASA